MSDKIYYSTNWMGPISKTWCDEHGDDWAGGRIDIYGDNLAPYGDEIGLPLMKVKDWNNFSSWLNTVITTRVYSLEELLEEYYKEGNSKITWFNREEKNDSNS